MKIKQIIFDVDGVFNTGQFLYTIDGKFAKIFGPHDNDGIKLLKPLVDIQAISADKRGWPITKKRIQEDMDIPLHQVSEPDRLKWFKTKVDPKQTIYMGDGYHDIGVFKIVAYSIAPASAFFLAKEAANFVTQSNAGEGAVLEACLHIKRKFLDKSK